jgi:hypothetical protein
MIAACRRMIAADRLGWRKYADPADWRFVSEFHAEMYHFDRRVMLEFEGGQHNTTTPISYLRFFLDYAATGPSFLR